MKKKTNKILILLMILIIIAGILMIIFKGFNFDLKYQDTKQIEFGLDKQFSISDIKAITDEVLNNEPVLIRKVEVYEDAVNITAREITDEQKANIITKVNEKYDNKELTEKWNKIIELKDIVAKELELQRANKTIGNSLDAKVTLYADGDEYKFLEDNKELLQEVFIISGLAIEKNERRDADKIGVKVEKADGEKCERCWTYSTTVGEDKDYPTLCHRCSEVMHQIERN